MRSLRVRYQRSWTSDQRTAGTFPAATLKYFPYTLGVTCPFRELEDVSRRGVSFPGALLQEDDLAPW